jgi:hypothetical protein
MRGPVAGLAVLALLAPGTASASPWSYLSRPTDQLAIPGVVPGVEITPEGYLSTGWDELQFRFGPALSRWFQPVRTLAAGRYPVLRSARRLGGVRYDLETFVDLVAGAPVAFVRVSMHNGLGRPTLARWSAGVCWSGGSLRRDGARRFRFPRPATPARPGLYWQPGEGFDPGAGYTLGDGTVLRRGRVLLVAPAATRVRLRAQAPDAPVRPASVFGEHEYDLVLGAHARAHVDLRLPIVPLDPAAATLAAGRAADHGAHRRAVLRAWRASLAGAIDVQLPERKVRDAFYASLVHILEARYRLADGTWVQAVNKLRYHAFWLRDAAMMANALDLAGLHAQAAEDLPFFAAWQRDDGLFLSREGQLDGLGQALWALGRHALMTGDSAFARAWLPAVRRAMAWLEHATADDPLGLVPAADPHDNELAAGHLAGDDFWAVDGAIAAAALARAAGDDATGDAFDATAQGLRRTVVARVRASAAAGDGTIPPVLDASAGLDWGNLWAAYPETVLAPDDPLVTRTLARVRRRFREGIATWGAGASLHGYLGFRVFETDLAAGRRGAALDGLYASLAHTTATHGGFESGVRPFARRLADDNLAPHGWFAAELVALVRNLLVRERDGGLELLGGVPARWVSAGGVAVHRAPTAFGRANATLRPRRGGALLTWRAEVPDGTPLWWRPPIAARAVTVAGARVVGALRLPGNEGALRVRWRLRRGGSSFAAVAARLRASYRVRGLAAP